jgi:hypothetical protein
VIAPAGPIAVLFVQRMLASRTPKPAAKPAPAAKPQRAGDPTPRRPSAETVLEPTS